MPKIRQQLQLEFRLKDTAITTDPPGSYGQLENVNLSLGNFSLLTSCVYGLGDF